MEDTNVLEDTNVRTTLLSLHRALVEFERRAYEKTHGRTSGAEFLQVLVRDPSLAWLAPLTSQIARLDELGDGSDATAQRRTWRARTRALLSAASKGPFGAAYAERVNLSPDVAFAHAAAVRAFR
jgi:hypothetical protein